jgi:hypothetical protein
LSQSKRVTKSEIKRSVNRNYYIAIPLQVCGFHFPYTRKGKPVRLLRMHSVISRSSLFNTLKMLVFHSKNIDKLLAVVTGKCCTCRETK